MSLSSNTLFHFTKNHKFLLSILKNGLYIRYSLETYGKMLKSKSELVLPMACFCDIPLSQIKDHTKKYGSYAIGLTKEWGIKNGLSPVIYAHEKSETAKILNSLSSDLRKIFDIDDTDKNKKLLKEWGYNDKDIGTINNAKFLTNSNLIKRNQELSDQLGHFLKYIKPYEGIGYSNGQKFNKVRFYDEREWRYVPPKNLLKKIEVKDTYSREFYDNLVRRRYINIQLANHKKLKFQPKDIKFIIVEKDNEIPFLIKQLREIFENTASHSDLMVLYSRLISLEQIIDDL